MSYPLIVKCDVVGYGPEQGEAERTTALRVKSWLRPAATTGIALLIVPLAIACGGGDDGGSDGGGNGPATTTATSPSGGGSSNGGAETVTIVMKDNIFEPKDIEVDEGKTVTFELKNEGTAIHNMHVLSKTAEGKDFMSKTAIEGGGSDTFTATFQKKGSIKFQCDYHVPDMAGTITVD
jgi:plastocyanin